MEESYTYAVIKNLLSGKSREHELEDMKFWDISEPDTEESPDIYSYVHELRLNPRYYSPNHKIPDIGMKKDSITFCLRVFFVRNFGNLKYATKIEIILMNFGFENSTEQLKLF